MIISFLVGWGLREIRWQPSMKLFVKESEISRSEQKGPSMTGSFAAAGNITKAEVSYGFADEVRGLSLPARRAVESGTTKSLIRNDECSISVGFGSRKRTSFLPNPFFTWYGHFSL